MDWATGLIRTKPLPERVAIQHLVALEFPVENQLGEITAKEMA